jgi:hypothetical protein
MAVLSGPGKKKRICFDIDGVLCTQTQGDYENATPDLSMIALVNRLYDEGHTIVLHTARYMNRCGQDPAAAKAMGYAPTSAQLEGWGVRFHELHLGKPSYDFVVDDRAAYFQPGAAAAAAWIRERVGL